MIRCQRKDSAVASAGARVGISAMSLPAQKARPRPETSTTETSLARSSRPSAFSSAAATVRFRTLSTAGRSSVSRATAPSTTRLTLVAPVSRSDVGTLVSLTTKALRTPGTSTGRSRRAATWSVRGHETQESELRPRAEAQGRSPRPRAGTDVDPHAAAAREPGRVRPVDQVNHERPRKELTGVRVSRQLQVEAGLLG